ncbi:MAG: hypothetical protein ABI165_06815 [Bryobacteraceae bacterium]
MSYSKFHPLIPILCVALAAPPMYLAAADAPATPAILQLRVVDGDGAVSALGSRATRGLTVEVTDETGKPVENATVSFQLPENGPGGVFSTGSRTEIVATRADGRATVWGMRWNRTPGAFEIRITAIKSQIRAGTLSSQYLSDSAAPAAGVSGPGFTVRHSHKWLYIGLVAAAAAGGGLAVGRSHSSSTAAASSATATGLSIGTPTVIIGGPQ